MNTQNNSIKKEMEDWERFYYDSWEKNGTDVLNPAFQQMLVSEKLNKLIEVIDKKLQQHER